jgi:hypothetical protein
MNPETEELLLDSSVPKKKDEFWGKQEWIPDRNKEISKLIRVGEEAESSHLVADRFVLEPWLIQDHL